MKIFLRLILIPVILYGSLAISIHACQPKQNGMHKAVIAHRNSVDCRIIAGQDDRVAAQSLQRFLHDQFHVKVDITNPDKAGQDNRKCEILVGREASNTYLAAIAGKHHINLGKRDLTPDGYVVRTVQDEGVDYVMAAGGGKRGVFYAVGELKNYCIRNINDSVVVMPTDVREIPAFKYRWFWTWDWRMEWGGVEPGGSKMGGGGNYRKSPGSYLADYKKCIDFMSENGFNGLIIWGFIRDAHGGVAAAQELCRYAEERGVRVLPGVGTSGYSGYVFEGDHRFNTRTWLKKHPELRMVDKDGKSGGMGPDGLSDHLCPSKKANQEWLDEGAGWLFENFKIGGVNLEMGDHFVCYCDDCRRARAAIQSDEPDYYKDMAISHSRTLRTMHAVAPDAWLSYATYTGFTKEMMTNPPEFLKMIPSYAICQWTLTHMVDSTMRDSLDPASGKGWPEGVKPMAEHNIGYLHWANKSTGTGHDFFMERLRRVARLAWKADMEGLVLYGELPDTRPNMQLNYLAFREYCFHPGMSKEEFTQKRLVPVYGTNSTNTLWEIIGLISTGKQRASGENVKEALELAASALKKAPVPNRQSWQDLYNYIASLE